MKFLQFLILWSIYLPAQGQYNPRQYHAFDEVKKLAFRKDLSEALTIPLSTTDSCASGVINNGVLYLLNNCNETVYTAMDLPVLYKGNFEIVAEVKIYCGETRDLLRDGFISWAVDGKSYTYNTFAFTNDKFYGFHSRNGKTGECRSKLYKIRDVYSYNRFARYTIRRYGDKYYFFINGRLIGTAAYLETDGQLLELGAAPKGYTLYKMLAVYYLP